MGIMEYFFTANPYDIWYVIYLSFLILKSNVYSNYVNCEKSPARLMHVVALVLASDTANIEVSPSRLAIWVCRWCLQLWQNINDLSHQQSDI